MNASSRSAASASRLLPERPLPPYAYVPGGRFPHPVRDPQGHSYGAEASERASLDAPEAWRRCEAYLWGIDLFNNGYYWEAHESWEALWLAAGRRGIVADVCKALIRLAAAGVKAREGRAEGVRRHSERARQILEAVAGRAADPQHPLMGLRLQGLASEAARVGRAPQRILDARDVPVVVVMPFGLHVEGG